MNTGSSIIVGLRLCDTTPYRTDIYIIIAGQEDLLLLHSFAFSQIDSRRSRWGGPMYHGYGDASFGPISITK